MDEIQNWKSNLDSAKAYPPCKRHFDQLMAKVMQKDAIQNEIKLLEKSK